MYRKQKCPLDFIDIITRYKKREEWRGMHILNNECKGTPEVARKTLWKGRENTRHNFLRAIAKGGGSWKQELKKLAEMDSGWFWADHRSRCPRPDIYRLQILANEWA